MKMKQLLITTIAIFGLAFFTNAQVPNYIPTNGLVAWWPFNGNANDESLNGNNGTVNGATLSTDRFGDFEKAYSFSSDFISVPHQNSLNAFPLSVFAWCNGNPLNYTNAIISKYQSSSNNGWEINANTGGKLSGYYFNFPGGSEMNFDIFQNELFTIIDNNWHHVGMICDNQSSRLYVDGELILEKNYSGSGGPSSPSNICNIYIGKNCGQVDSSVFFNGKIDDIGIWNRALSQEEITSLNSGSPLGINETLQSNLFSVSPNPAQNQINVNTDDKLVGSVYTIYDNIGKAVKTGKLNSVNTTIELNDLSGGFYFFRVGDNLKKTFKVIKE